MEAYEKMRRLREKRKISQEELGVAMGYAPGQARQSVSKIERGLTKLTVDALVKGAEKLQVDPAQLLTVQELDEAPGVQGLLDGAIEHPGDSIPLIAYDGSPERRIAGQVARPPSLRGVRHAYAYYAPDDSMHPRYSAGWLLYVNPAKPPRAGRDVIVLRRTGAPIVRCLSSVEADEYIFKALSAPEPQRISKAEIQALHLIVGSDQDA